MIYVTEDDRGIRELVVYTLKSTGFDALGFEDAAGLCEAIGTAKPELILLDIMLPGEDGISLLRRLRSNAATSDIPVIMMTAKDTEYDKVLGLDSGADDYIAKPFGMMELVSRVKAVLRRSAKAHDCGAYAYGGVVLNESSHTVMSNGINTVLTLKEFELLRLMMKNPGKVFTRDMLLESIWGYEFTGETRTVDVHIRTLRSKLGKGGDIIETVRGVGYRIGGAS